MSDLDYPTEGKYIIKDGKVVGEKDLLRWGSWLESKEGQIARRIEWTEVPGYRISTVFLGLDQRMGYGDEGEPVLFETMVFEKKETETEIFGKKMKHHRAVECDGCFERYTTMEKAREGHARIVEFVTKNKPKNHDSD